MKHKIIFLVMIAVLVSQTFAQIFAGADTIYGNSIKYHYSEWYTDCGIFFTDTANFVLVGKYTAIPTLIFGKQQYTSHPIEVKGVAALVAINSWDVGYGSLMCLTPERLREYVFLYKHDPTQPNGIAVLDSARWDTASPQILAMPKYANAIPDSSRDYYYCAIYNAYFTRPVTVDSVFYTGGTFHSNQYVYDSELGIDLHPNIPSIYVGIREPQRRATCPPQYTGMEYIYPEGYIYEFPPPYSYGYFLPIVDNLTLNVVSGDTLMGQVTGGGVYPENSYDTIAAIPYAGYMFSHWNDGGTNNPRTICLTQDTTLIAYFCPADGSLTLNVVSGDTLMGQVTGGGVYPENSYDTIAAIPYAGYMFSHWNDGGTDNPRVIWLTQDTTLIAYFCPADGSLTLNVVSGDTLMGQVTGGGVYPENSYDTIAAIPYAGYMFSHWNDGGTDNPRVIWLAQDTTFTANFRPFPSGIAAANEPLSFTVAPNPAHNQLSVSGFPYGEYHIAIYSINGMCIIQNNFVGHDFTLDLSGLAPGHYLLNLFSDTKRGTQVIIKE